jgi:hypothetical protein
MSDADIHAFGPPASAAAPVAPARRRRIWPWLVGLALLGLLATAVMVAGVLHELALLRASGWDVLVDGERVRLGEDFGFGTVVLALVGIALAAVVVIVAVPLALLLALLAALFGVALGLGLPLLLLLGVLAVLLSPLGLAALALWLVLRKPRPRPAG